MFQFLKHWRNLVTVITDMRYKLMVNAIFKIQNKVTGESWLGKSNNPEKQHKKIVAYMNGEIKDSPMDYDDNCDNCKYFDNCLGWDNKPLCREYMRNYFKEHKNERLKE